MYRQPKWVVYLNMMVFGGQPLPIGLIVDTYIKTISSNILAQSSVRILNGWNAFYGAF